MGLCSPQPVQTYARPPETPRRQSCETGDNVADLGCGTGLLTFALADAVGPDGKVWAIDHDEQSITAVRRRLATRSDTNIETDVASATSLNSVPDRSLDFVLSNLVLCCLVDHDGAVAEIARVLKSDGSANMSVARWGRRSHPTHVDRREWSSILERFRVIRQGSKIAQHWALVSV